MKKVILILLLIMGIVLLSGCVQKQKEELAVVVNGVEITKDEFVQKLIQNAGEPVLEQMVSEILIKQKAEEQKVKVQSKEIDVKIDEIREQFPSKKAFAQQLLTSSITIKNLRQQFESQILMEKLILKEDATLTQQEILTKRSTFLKDIKEEAEIEIMLPELREVAAVVNGAEITKDEFVQRLTLLTGKRVLEDMIDDLIIRQKAKEQNVEVKPEEIDVKVDEVKGRFPTEEGFIQFAERNGMTVEELRQQFESEIFMEKIVLKEAEAMITEEEIKDYFERSKDRLDKPDQIKASHILVKTEEEANEILSQLRAGADFAELAKENSIDSATKDEGGDLGFFSLGRMTPAFEEAAFALETGEISDMVKTPYGYHIIQLEEKKPAYKATLELAREEIKEVLTQQNAWTLERNFLQDLREEAEIEIMLPELRDKK